MAARLWLRISALIATLFALGHTLGSRKDWSPQGDNPVLQQMRDVHFNVMGVSRSYFDFYMAFGYSLSVFMFMQAILLWQLSGLVVTDAARTRPMLAVITAAAVLMGIISWLLLFPVPAYFSLVLIACLVVALLKAR
ncbi:MAG: hypothetical protein JSR66_10275 [Proteobacteria bacterium]|nr:hypothetical protein [Pseudomonadota bacterium]